MRLFPQSVNPACHTRTFWDVPPRGGKFNMFAPYLLKLKGLSGKKFTTFLKRIKMGKLNPQKGSPKKRVSKRCVF